MEWDESKHPRDKRGRFTDGKSDNLQAKTASELAKEIAIHLEKRKITIIDAAEKLGYKAPPRVPLDYFGNKEKNENGSALQIPPKEAFGFARLDTEHHKKHSDEMGFKDVSAYEKASIEYWNTGKGEIYFSQLTKRFYKYSVDSTRFLSIDKEGIIHTFFLLPSKDFKRKTMQERLIKYDK